MYVPHPTHDPSCKEDKMFLVKSQRHEYSEAIPREQWMCPSVFIQTTKDKEDARLGWKDVRTRISPSREHRTARDLKYHELSSSLFGTTRLEAAPEESESMLLSSFAHFLHPSKTKDPPHTDESEGCARRRFKQNLMASANNKIPAATAIEAISRSNIRR